MRLRLVSLLLLVLVPMGALWSAFRSHQSEQAAQAQSARDTTRLVALLFDREFSRYDSVARALASTLAEARAAPAESDWRQLEEALRRSLEGSPARVVVRSENTAWIDTMRRARSDAAAPALLPDATGDLRGAPALDAVRSPDGALRGVALTEPVYGGQRGVALNVVVLLPAPELHGILQRHLRSEAWIGALLDGAGQVAMVHPLAPTAALEGAARTVAAQDGSGAAAEGWLETADAHGNPLRAYFARLPQGWTYVTAFASDRAGEGVGAQWPRLLGWVLVVGAGVWFVRRWLRRFAGRPRSPGAPGGDRAPGATPMPAPGGVPQAGDAAERRARREVVGRLTDSVAHEFNNLLGVISNSAHLVKRQAGDPRLTLPIEATLRAVEAAGRLIHQLQRFGDAPTARPQPLDLSRWLPALREMMAVVVGKRIGMTISVDRQPLRVCVDPAALELGLFNAVLDAKESLAPGGHIELSAGMLAPRDHPPRLPPGRYVEIRIKEEGAQPDPSGAPPGPPALPPGPRLRRIQALCTRAGGMASVAVVPGSHTVVSLIFAEMTPPGAGRA